MSDLQGFFPGIERAWDDVAFKVCLTQHEKVALCVMGGVSQLFATCRWSEIPPASREALIRGARLAIVMGRELSAAMLYNAQGRNNDGSR